jgi:enoyl-CoA hydratase/carnithine racemase
MAYINKNLKTHSNFALRQAVKASRSAYVDTIKKQLIKVESQYLDELMQASDPIEGLTAFVEKRPPVYKDN